MRLNLIKRIKRVYTNRFAGTIHKGIQISIPSREYTGTIPVRENADFDKQNFPRNNYVEFLHGMILSRLLRCSFVGSGLYIPPPPQSLDYLNVVRDDVAFEFTTVYILLLGVFKF